MVPQNVALAFLVTLFKKAVKITKYLGYFCKKNVTTIFKNYPNPKLCQRKLLNWNNSLRISLYLALPIFLRASSTVWFDHCPFSFPIGDSNTQPSTVG